MQFQYLTNQEVDRRALAHRRALGFKDEQAIDMMTLLTKLKLKYPNFNFRRVEDGSVGDAEAQWDSDTKRIIIPESTFCAANVGRGRSLFSVVHEVGHALLGHKGLLNRAPTGNDAERLSKRISSMEREARRYAASFLIPDTLQVRRMLSETISFKYNTSLETAKIWKREHP